ncbi:hypothetical protein AAZX31_09G107100 [Glycine max]
MPSTWLSKSFCSYCKSLQHSNNLSPSNLVRNNLAKMPLTLEDSWWFDFTTSMKAMVALATLGRSCLQTMRAVAIHLVTFASKDATLRRASWCRCAFSFRIAKLLLRKTLVEFAAFYTPSNRIRFLSKVHTKLIEVFCSGL